MSRNSSFAGQQVDPKMADDEIRRKIIFMFKFVAELIQEGVIIDFSIYRSSLEQVFKRMILASQPPVEVHHS